MKTKKEKFITKCCKCGAVLKADTYVLLCTELDKHLTNDSCGYVQTTPHRYIRHIKEK